MPIFHDSERCTMILVARVGVDSQMREVGSSSQSLVFVSAASWIAASTLDAAASSQTVTSYGVSPG